MQKIFDSFNSLESYILKENYKGWDPYDGLNSQVFQKLPFFKNNRFCRLAWIQLFKRSPINLRKLLFVAKGHNSKGLALFLAGYCKLYQINKNEEILFKINELTEILLSSTSKGWSGNCWGYNFDWQARAFFQPKNTPTVVASVYVASALLDAYEITKQENCLQAAVSCCNFILKDLNRNFDTDGDFCFSYSPLDKSIVYNASLLGSRLLSRVYAITGNEEFKNDASKSVKFCIKNQQPNGSWAYGQQSFHYWIDNFHTGFNLECLFAYSIYTKDESVNDAIEKGFDYYINTFFDEKGRSKYYNNKLFPIDIHAPAQLVVTLSTLKKFEQYRHVVEKVLLWTIDNMQHSKGYFYYQIKSKSISKIPYMRWAQAWMFYAFCIYKKEINESRTI